MSSGTLENLGHELAKALHPLEERLQAGEVIELISELGIQFPPSLDTQSGFIGSITAAGQLAGELGPLSVDLAAAIESDDIGEILRLAIEIIDVLRVLIPALDDIGTELDGLSASFPGIPQAELQAFAAQLPKRLFDYVVVSYLEGFHPIVNRLLALLGVVEFVDVPGVLADDAKPSYMQRNLRLERIGELFASPDDLLADLYGWGTGAFDGVVMLERLQELLTSASIAAAFDAEATPPELRLFGIRLSPRNDLAPPGIEAMLELELPAGIDFSFPVLAPNFLLELGLDAELQASTGIILQPPADITFVPPSGSVQGEVRLGLARLPAPGSDAIVVLGLPGGSGLSAQRIAVGIAAGFRDSAGDFGIDGEVTGGKLILTLEGADGFIGEIMSGVGLEADFNLGLGWRAGSGVYFTGSGELEIQLPSHIDLGPIAIDAITCSVGIEDRAFPIGLTADIKAMLGPLQAVVEQIGVRADLTFPADGKGQLGPVDFGLGFQPPAGVGLSLDAGAIKGGGYLFFDFDREEYAGALELVFSEWITLKAIGLVTTRMPDGSDGFSLLIIVTAEFGTGFQLGFGFTLDGVGGILGLNRIVNVDPLREGIQTGAIESVMFPEDVIANAPRIISDLRKFFPPQADIFLVGPMAKIGWGTPTLVTAKLGVILEFPNVDITILGVIKVVLPDEEADVLRLQVNFMGRIEPSNKQLWFYAYLFDSRVLFITLEGGFGLLVNWGDNANFVVSVGGFHPKYSPPALPFPEPPRIAVNILNESYARVRIEAYFAVTSNSVQFGAKAELYFGVSEFRIEGHLAFDALFQFDPFFFSFGLSVKLSVKVFGVGLFSVGFSGLLEGPTPWHIEGKGKISILFFSISVPFKHTWGDNQDTKLDPIEVFPLLEQEFDALTNWEARVPDSNNLLVSLRKLGEADTDQLVLHPVGKLRVSQRKIPINFRFDKVGNNRPSDVNQIDVDVDLPGVASLTVTKVEDSFAVGQFKDLDGSNQLSSPGFEPLESGVEIGVAGEQLKTSRAVRRVIRYESIIIDNNFKRHVKPFFRFFELGFAVLNEFLFAHFMTGNSATQSVLSQHSIKRMQPFDEVISIQPNLYSVASTTDNRPLDSGTVAFTSQAKAQQFMEEQIRSGAAVQNDLHVVPNTELNLAA